MKLDPCRVHAELDVSQTDYELFVRHCLTDKGMLAGDLWLDVLWQCCRDMVGQVLMDPHVVLFDKPWSRSHGSLKRRGRHARSLELLAVFDYRPGQRPRQLGPPA